MIITSGTLGYMTQKTKHTILKTGTYSMMHITVAVLVAYVLSGDIRVALGIGIIEPMVQTVFFFMHDRAWSKIQGYAGEPRPDAEYAAVKYRT